MIGSLVTAIRLAQLNRSSIHPGIGSLLTCLYSTILFGQMEAIRSERVIHDEEVMVGLFFLSLLGVFFCVFVVGLAAGHGAS
jgi:hypothetical protein